MLSACVVIPMSTGKKLRELLNILEFIEMVFPSES